MGHLKPVCRICVCLQIGEVLNCCQQSFRLIIVQSAVLKLRKWRHMNCIEFVQLSAARIFCVVSQLRSSSSSRRARQFQICVQSHSLQANPGPNQSDKPQDWYFALQIISAEPVSSAQPQTFQQKIAKFIAISFSSPLLTARKKSTHKPQAI